MESETEKYKCPNCDGYGKTMHKTDSSRVPIWEQECEACDGTGFKKETMENKTVTVTGCKNCLFCQYDELEGFGCEHPAYSDVPIFRALKYQWVYEDGKSPESCPLKQQSITIQFKEK